MKTQTLYDFRTLTGFCSGKDLHEFFAHVVGDPSPGGNVEIDASEALDLIVSNLDAMEANNQKDVAIVEDCRIARRLATVLCRD